MDNKINSISINSKSNGIILKMELDTLSNKNKITAWQAKTGWFYLTIYKVSGKSDELKPEFIPNEIQKFQIINNNESMQIGIRIIEPIENYDFIYNEENNTIIANLHYSIDYFTTIDNSLQFNQTNIKKSIPKSNVWLYKIGAFISLLGLMDNDDKNNNKASKIGIGILVTTFLIDKIIENNLNI